MVQLYNRDAQVVTEILGFAAEMFSATDGNARDVAYGKLLSWTPEEIRDAEGVPDDRRRVLVSTRLHSIIAAILEQQREKAT
jgi:hypothetical protein